MPHLVATALAGAALALLPAVPAGAATARPGADAASVPGREPAGRTSLRLTLDHPGGSASASRTVTLLCDPAGGSHPEAAGACAELGRSGGRFAREPGDGACTMIYAPVVAEAEGLWRGRQARFRAEYDNDCTLRSRTGTIFAF